MENMAQASPEDPESDADTGGGDKEGSDENGWQDLMDGAIRKRVLTPGQGATPEFNQDVRCSVEVRVLEEGDWGQNVLETRKVAQHHPKVRYRVGDGEAAPMLELALRNMQEGEECEVIGRSRMGFGPMGRKASGPEEEDVLPDTDVHMRVVLQECITAAKKTADEVQAWNASYEEALWRKENGNDHFRRRELARAKKCYAAGVAVFGGSFEAPPNAGHDTDAALGLAADCGSNLAAVLLEQGDLNAAKDAATEALVLRPTHVKAMYRAARACLLMHQFEECDMALRRLSELESDEDPSVKRLAADLRKAKQQYVAKSKRMGEKLFQDGLNDEADTPSDTTKECQSWRRRCATALGSRVAAAASVAALAVAAGSWLLLQSPVAPGTVVRDANA